MDGRDSQINDKTVIVLFTVYEKLFIFYNQIH